MWMTLKILLDKCDINSESESDGEEALRGVMMCRESRMERIKVYQPNDAASLKGLVKKGVHYVCTYKVRICHLVKLQWLVSNLVIIIIQIVCTISLKLRELLRLATGFRLEHAYTCNHSSK